MKKHQTDFKLKVVTGFLAGDGGAKMLARQWSLPEEKIRTWVTLCKNHRAVCICAIGKSAELQLLAIATAIAAFCALHRIPIRSAHIPLDSGRGSLAAWGSMCSWRCTSRCLRPTRVRSVLTVFFMRMNSMACA